MHNLENLDDNFFEENNIYKRKEKTNNLPIVFYYKIIFDEKESLEKGRLIFKNKAFIDINTGENDIKTFQVTDEFIERYKEQWKQFKNFATPLIKSDNENESLEDIYEKFPKIFEEYKKNIKNVIGYEGTLIEEINIFPLTKVTELKYYGYFYLEQILEIHGPNEIITQEMLEIARNWKKKQEENEVLKRQVLELSELVRKLTEKIKG